MKYLKKFTFVLFVSAAMLVSFSSCEDSVADAVCNADAEAAAYQAAITAFSSNPTRSTCNALVSAAQDLINKASQCGGGIDISAAQASLDTIDCSVF